MPHNVIQRQSERESELPTKEPKELWPFTSLLPAQCPGMERKVREKPTEPLVRFPNSPPSPLLNLGSELKLWVWAWSVNNHLGPGTSVSQATMTDASLHLLFTTVAVPSTVEFATHNIFNFMRLVRKTTDSRSRSDTMPCGAFAQFHLPPWKIRHFFL